MGKIRKLWPVWTSMLLAALLLAGALLSVSGNGKLTTANFNRIRVGMSLTEVQEILGKADLAHQRFGSKTSSLAWFHDSPDVILVYFDSKNEVVRSEFQTATIQERFEWLLSKMGGGR